MIKNVVKNKKNNNVNKIINKNEINKNKLISF